MYSISGRGSLVRLRTPRPRPQLARSGEWYLQHQVDRATGFGRRGEAALYLSQARDRSGKIAVGNGKRPTGLLGHRPGGETVALQVLQRDGHRGDRGPVSRDDEADRPATRLAADLDGAGESGAGPRCYSGRAVGVGATGAAFGAQATR